MVELESDELIFRFPEVHEDAVCRLNVQRTLRIPDDDRAYPLPPGLGSFPIEHVEDYAERLPTGWSEHGGVLLPMYQGEALWISFYSGGCFYPCAAKIAAGRINAVTGEPWSKALGSAPQNYLVIPDQPWLDGFCVKQGLIRQFVAMPLGAGYTAEEQLAEKAEYGGLQVLVYPMKRKRYEELVAKRKIHEPFPVACYSIASMGLAPGGLMRQEIFEDQYGLDAWDQSFSARCFVHILNSVQWKAATGRPSPGKPPTAADYTEAGLPWFEYYSDHLVALGGSTKLAGMDSVAVKGAKKGEQPLSENEPVKPELVIKLGKKVSRVNEGNG
jgi:hypothetical protein